jgi:hypothetical protein
MNMHMYAAMQSANKRQVDTAACAQGLVGTCISLSLEVLQ